MRRTSLLLAAIFALGAEVFCSSLSFAATDGVYTLAETTAAWDGTDANRLNTPTADYDHTYGDEASLAYTLPWPFTFYGQPYSQGTPITIDTNGNIWFTATGSAHSFSLASTGRGPVIAAWNNDLSSNYYGGAFIQHKTNPERVVVQWQTESYTDEGEHRVYDMEAVLFPNGAIRFDFKTFDTANGNDFGSGISMDDGTHFLNLTTAYGSANTLAGRSFLFSAMIPDITAPIVAGFTMPARSASLTVPVTTFTATDNVGVTGYLITESNTQPSSGAAGWTSSAPAAYTAAAAGSHTLYPWAKDAAGNVSAIYGSPKTVVIDTTIPTVSGFAIPTTSTSLTVPITTFTATDNVGVTGYMITENSTPPSSGAAGWTSSAPATYTAAAAGSHTLYPWAKDAAGNVSAVYGSPKTVVIDTIVPTVSGFTMPAISSSRTVTVTTFTATDNLGVTGYLITESSTRPTSGAAGWTTSRPASYTAATYGSHTLYPWAKDAAGNVSSVYGSPKTVVISCAGTGC